MKLSLYWLYAVAAAAVANDEFQFENVICCSILFDASTFTTKCMAIANAFKTSKINVKRNVIQSMCARLPIHVVTLYLALAFFRLPSIRFFHCSECVRFFSHSDALSISFHIVCHFFCHVRSQQNTYRQLKTVQ